MQQLLILLLFVMLATARKHFLLHTIHGEVDAESFAYYTLKYNGPIRIVLKTMQGDADLYVSERTMTPSYDVNEYDLYSATCGVDFVDIPEAMKRPMGIGIYGHYSHDKSLFVMDIYLQMEGDDADLIFENMSHSDYSDEDNIKSSIKHTAFLTFLEKWEYVQLILGMFL